MRDIGVRVRKIVRYRGDLGVRVEGNSLLGAVSTASCRRGYDIPKERALKCGG